jgi:hypothetical protein
MYDKIMSHYGSESPRSMAKAKVWQNAYQSSNDLRQLLGDPWLNQRNASWERSVMPDPEAQDPALAFFPPDWSNVLSEETLAELVIDAYSSSFVDAFLDGAITLVEVSNQWNAGQSSTLHQSASEPSLQKPREKGRFQNGSPSPKALLGMGSVEQEPTGAEGFIMNGLTGDNWEAWNSRSFHKCKPLDPFLKRIEKATESQRPQRCTAERQRPNVKQSTSEVDLRKYAFPMTKTNFPEAYERTSRFQRKPVREAPKSENAPADWLIKVGEDGKTRFPYSLVSHRAFLESQKDPHLKEKAERLAPLRLSSQSY